MLSSVRQLVSGEKRTMGNHRREVSGDIESFIYHWTSICTVNHKKGIFVIDNGGWNTQSTNRAINDYRYYFLDKGYTEVDMKTFEERMGA